LNFYVTQNMENCEIWKVEVYIKNTRKTGELKNIVDITLIEFTQVKQIEKI
jgi:hypothetical protein